MTDGTATLAGLRRRALSAILLLLWVQVPVVGLVCLVCGNNPILPVVIAALLAGAGQGLAKLDPLGDLARLGGGVLLVLSVSVLVGAMAGSKMQVDLHMVYFVALAALVATCDRRVIAAAATTIVIHHLVLNLVLPGLIYPGGADFARVALHATVVGLEGIVLVWTTAIIEGVLSAVAVERQEAEVARAEADAHHRRAVTAAEETSRLHAIHDGDRARVAEEDAATLRQLGHAMKRLAEGDLAHRIDHALPEKAEPLRADFNSAMEQLQSVLRSVATSAAGIRSGTAEISVSANDLSRRTEQQAASLEETAASIDEITATVRRSAEGARKARDAVSSARSEAERSGEVVREAIRAMGAIEKSSQQINQIIGVIDEIAFQTNLLALNAGVEAARAGEAGKGFAVVASEVRGLAQRSAGSAKEIKDLISTSSRQVGEGVDLVAETGKVLDRIVTQVADVNTVVFDIAASSDALTGSLDQIGGSINEMDQITQKNAAMVEQSTVASHSLAKEADGLTQILARFRFGEVEAERSMTRFPSSSAAKPVAALKAVGRGGAARAPEPAAGGWEEF